MINTKKNKQIFLDALEQNLGVITSACRATKIPRASIYQWIHNDPEFKARVEDINEQTIDFVESKLHQKIKGVRMVDHQKSGDVIYETPPDTTAIIFYLKTKAKARGYVERQEIEHSGKFNVTLPKELQDETD